MILPIKKLKSACKKLSLVYSKDIVFDDTGIFSIDSDIGVKIFDIKISDIKYCVDSRLFIETVSKLNSDIDINILDNSIRIKCGKFISTLPIKETTLCFPEEQKLYANVLCQFKPKDIQDLLEFTSSVTVDKNTFDHTGTIKIKTIKNKLFAYATDNMRIASIEIPCEESYIDILIPSRLSSFSKEFEGIVSLIDSNKLVYILCDSNDLKYVISARKIISKFPDIYKVYPKSYLLEVKINKDVLLDSFSRLYPSLDKEDTIPRIDMEFEDNILKLKTKLSEDSIDTEVLGFPEKINLAVNAGFVKDFLTEVYGDVTIKTNGTSIPFMMESGNKNILMAGLR